MPRFMYPAAVEYVDFLNKAGDDIHDAYEEGYADGMRDAVKHGCWEMKWNIHFHRELPTCSRCRKSVVFRFAWCPHCGALMDLEVATE